MASTIPDNQEAIEIIRKLIKGIDTAMLTTVSEEGLVSHPMKTQDVEFDGDFSKALATISFNLQKKATLV